MNELVDQPTNMPTRKVTAAGGGSATGTIIAVLLAIFVLPSDVAAETVVVLTGAFTTLGAFLFGWWFRERA